MESMGVQEIKRILDDMKVRMDEARTAYEQAREHYAAALALLRPEKKTRKPRTAKVEKTEAAPRKTRTKVTPLVKQPDGTFKLPGAEGETA